MKETNTEKENMETTAVNDTTEAIDIEYVTIQDLEDKCDRLYDLIKEGHDLMESVDWWMGTAEYDLSHLEDLFEGLGVLKSSERKTIPWDSKVVIEPKED